MDYLSPEVIFPSSLVNVHELGQAGRAGEAIQTHDPLTPAMRGLASAGLALLFFFFVCLGWKVLKGGRKLQAWKI